MTLKTLTDLLVSRGMVHPRAIEDAESFDHGRTIGAITSLYNESGIAALRDDKARLDWLEKQYANLRFYYVVGSDEAHRRTWAAPRIRALLDEALADEALLLRQEANAKGTANF